MNRFRIPSLCLAAFWALSGPAPAHEADFGERVKTYILENPEVILQAITLLSEREAQLATKARVSQFPQLFTDPPRLGIGSGDAPIKVVKFFDYRCAPCKAMHPVLRDFVAEHPEVRVEMRHLPILSPGSDRAARFALATAQVFGDTAHGLVHDALWTVRGPLNEDAFRGISEDLGLDFALIEAAMKDAAVTERVTFNRDVAIALEILGTPAFVAPSSVLVGETDISALSQAWLNQ